MNSSSQSFRLSFVSGPSELLAPPASEILASVRGRPPWDEASITPDQEQFPRMHISRCEDYGFVLHCFEDGKSWGNYLVTNLAFHLPSLKSTLEDRRLSDGRGSCSFRSSLQRKHSVFSWPSVSAIRRNGGQQEMDFPGRPYAKADSNEKGGKIRERASHHQIYKQIHVPWVLSASHPSQKTKRLSRGN